MEKVQYIYHWNRIFAAVIGLALLIIAISFIVYSLITREIPEGSVETPIFTSQQKLSHQDYAQPSISESALLTTENQQQLYASSISESDQSSPQKIDNLPFDFAQFQSNIIAESNVTELEDEAPPLATNSPDSTSISESDPSSLQKPDSHAFELKQIQSTLVDDKGMPAVEFEEALPSSTADTNQTSITQETIEKTPLEPNTNQFFYSSNTESSQLQQPEITTSLNQGELSTEYHLQNTNNLKTFHLQEIKKFSPSVKRFTLARAITDREPVGSVDSISMDSNGLAIVYAFSEIIGMKDQTLNYYWYHGKERVAKVPIHIGNNRWRINSSKYINDKMLGTWSVELQTDDGRILANAKFISFAQYIGR